MPTASAAEAPPEEPPDVRALHQGLNEGPCTSLSVCQRSEKAGVLVRPTITAPALRQFATGGESSCATSSLNATTPLIVGWPTWSMFSLMVTGTPCSAP